MAGACSRSRCASDREATGRLLTADFDQSVLAVRGNFPADCRHSAQTALPSVVMMASAGATLTTTLFTLTVALAGGLS